MKRRGCWIHKQMEVDLPVSKIPLKGTVMPPVDPAQRQIPRH